MISMVHSTTFSLAKSDIIEAFIPFSIKKIDYCCFGSCFKLKKIEFEESLSLQSIYSEAFSRSTIEEFTIPSKVSILMKNWLYCTQYFTHLSASPEKNFFSMIENKILVGEKKDDYQHFNTLVFANRDVKSVVIPSYIE